MGDVVKKLTAELGAARRPRSFHVEVHVWAHRDDSEDEVARDVKEGLRRQGRDAIVRSVSPAQPSEYAGRSVRIVTEKSS